jgi:hypothetical protein
MELDEEEDRKPSMFLYHQLCNRIVKVVHGFESSIQSYCVNSYTPVVVEDSQNATENLAKHRRLKPATRQIVDSKEEAINRVSSYLSIP